MFLSVISNVLPMGVLNTETVLKIFKKNLQCSELFHNNSLEKRSIKIPIGKKVGVPHNDKDKTLGRLLRRSPDLVHDMAVC